eukprot:scaffold301614_cov28-Tisochrysis_lutea.AAC.2
MSERPRSLGPEDGGTVPLMTGAPSAAARGRASTELAGWSRLHSVSRPRLVSLGARRAIWLVPVAEAGTSEEAAASRPSSETLSPCRGA